jgi:hypothetical protein
MRFKLPELKDEFWQMPAMLQVIAIFFEQTSLAVAQVDPVVTRIMEKVAGSSGVHEAGRAIDFRDQFGEKRLYTPTQVIEITSRLNERFPGNDTKGTCIHHSFKGMPYHFHLQISSGDKYPDDLDCMTVV